MPNVTMSFYDELLKQARMIAVEQDTSLTGLIRAHLQALVEREKVLVYANDRTEAAKQSAAIQLITGGIQSGRAVISSQVPGGAS